MLNFRNLLKSIAGWFALMAMISFVSTAEEIRAAEIDSDLIFDDNAGDSPQLQLMDEDNFLFYLMKSDSGQAILKNTESIGSISFMSFNDMDDYLTIETPTDQPSLFWEGVLSYTNRPGIRISATGELEYRDEDENSWTPFDNLMSGVAGLDDLSDVSLTSTAQGDILYFDGTNWVNLAPGTSGQILQTQGAGANPVWASVTATEIDPTLTDDGSVIIGSGASDPTTLTFDSDGATDGTIVWDGTNDEFEISNGSLGIGTTSPSSVLHVDSNAINTAPILTLENTAGDFQVFRIDTSPEGVIVADRGDIAVNTSNGTLYIKTDDGDATGWDQLSTVSGASVDLQQAYLNGSNISLNAANGDIGIATSAGNDVLFLDQSTSNVGVGTTNPADFKLEVAGSIGPSTDDTYDLGSSTKRWRDLYLGPSSLHIGDDTNEAIISYDTANDYIGVDTNDDGVQDFVFTDTGKLGVGTTEPDAMLDIQAPENTEFIRLNDSGNSDSVGIYTGSGTPLGTVSAQAGSLFLDQLGVLYVNTDGGVLWSPLAVSTNVSTLQTAYIGGNRITLSEAEGDFEIDTDGGDQVLFVEEATGEVGLGTNDPKTKVEIDGTLSYTPSDTVFLGNGDQLAVTDAIMRIQSTSGAVTLASSSIEAGSPGQMVTIIGMSDANTVRFLDSATVELDRGVSFRLGINDTLTLIYDGLSWKEIRRSNS